MESAWNGANLCERVWLVLQRPLRPLLARILSQFCYNSAIWRRRYHGGCNYVTVRTSEQVKQLIAALSEETDDVGKKATPFGYKESYTAMYAQLMLKDKPVMNATRTEEKITVSGKTYGLQLFLDSLG